MCGNPANCGGIAEHVLWVFTNVHPLSKYQHLGQLCLA